MLKLLQDPRVKTAVGLQCRYGLATRTKSGTEAPAMQPTRFAASYPQMLARLDLTCERNHKHEWLMGGRAAGAAFYPKALVLEIMRGIRDTDDAEALLRPGHAEPH